MGRPLVLLSGFGPFEGVERNPSGEVARALAASPPSAADVLAAVLPVSFTRAPESWGALEACGAPRRPDLLVALGVHGDRGFVLERVARGRLADAERPDVDGTVAFGATDADARDRETVIDLHALRSTLRASGVLDVRISEDAGGYVCERLYSHVLGRGGALGVPALFVHVPPLAATPLDEQVRVVRLLVDCLVRRL